jgi:hypothetical protein
VNDDNSKKKYNVNNSSRKRHKTLKGIMIMQKQEDTDKIIK